MFDLGAGELLLIVIVAVIVIGPKDIPLAMRTAGRWIGKIRRVSGHFRAGLDTMIREAEMEEMEKKWAAQNAKIMKEHPADAAPEMEPTGALPSPAATPPAAPPAPEASAEARAEPPVPPPEAQEPQLPFGKRK
ncbi:twin-arginine translocase subunit TatB [Altererythrobacter soli]|uniref:Sec-independent protein translocase protein TatB n=1 Tax=Croceibacterium soli TaxID=1739690 RepID=A0A6I4UV54_9SPHN|nr:Sec-independent protein translocase protein TatB [Croceibacterium soli]MXP41714.1 twin-arginine translocase subunit TatB [Croceibacterium soli]